MVSITLKNREKLTFWKQNRINLKYSETTQEFPLLFYSLVQKLKEIAGMNETRQCSAFFEEKIMASGRMDTN